MKKILVLITLIVNSYIIKANEGYTYYDEVSGNWQWVYCEGNPFIDLQGGGRSVTVQSSKTEYLYTQVNSAEPGFFLRKNDSLTVSLENKVIIEDARTYNNTVGPEATIGILKFVSNISTAIKNAFSYEVKINRTPYTLKGGPWFAGIGVQGYTGLAGKRVGSYCLKLQWVPNRSTNRYEWKKFEVGNPGPHPDGYIVEDGSYQWFWANWKFVPFTSTTDGTSAEPQGVSFLQWGKYFNSEKQGFLINNNLYIRVDMYDSNSQNEADLDGNAGFTLIDRTNPNGGLELKGFQYNIDESYKNLGETKVTFRIPDRPSRPPGDGQLRAKGNPYNKELDCYIVGGSVTIRFTPKVEILAIDNLVYTTTGINRITYNSNGRSFLCTTLKDVIDYRYPKTISTDKVIPFNPGLGYKYW